MYFYTVFCVRVFRKNIDIVYKNYVYCIVKNLLTFFLKYPRQR